MRPRVSVLLTCYNHIRWLPACLESVCKQTYQDFEVLALDDRSTDGTREWLQSRTEPFLRVHLNEQNLGTYGTLNRGLELARGEFIAVLNDDDLWAERKLELQVAAMDEDPEVGIVHTHGWFIDADGARMQDPQPLGFPFPVCKEREAMSELIHNNRMITSSVLVRRSSFDKAGAFDPSYYGCGDWHMWLRICRTDRLALVDEPLTFYRVHEVNASRDSDRMNEDGLRIRKMVDGWRAETAPSRLPAKLRAAFAHNLACMGTEFAWKGDMAGSRRAYEGSIRLMPLRVKSYARWLLSFLPRAAFRKLN